MQTTTNTTKIIIAIIIVIAIGLGIYMSRDTDGIMDTDSSPSTTVSTSTTSSNNGTQNNGTSENNTISSKPSAITTATPKQNPLAGTSWVWTNTSFANKATALAPKDGKFVITFGTDGAVTSTTDCNSTAGRYAVNNDRVTITALVSTQKACAAPTLEADYVKELTQVSNFVFESTNKLDLVLGSNVGTMSFSRK